MADKFLEYRKQKNRRELKQENKNLRGENITDFKTGLLNERGLSREIVQQIQHASRTGESLTIVFIDADNFKNINTKYKYSGGDILLRAIAKAMNEEFRSEDSKSRWGGDEFVVLMTREFGKKTPEIESLKERLNKNIKSNLPMEFDTNDVSITLATLEWDGENPEELLSKVQNYVLEHKSKNV